MKDSDWKIEQTNAEGRKERLRREKNTLMETE